MCDEVKNWRQMLIERIMRSKAAMTVMAILGIAAGVFFIVSGQESGSISRAETETRSGAFETYVSGRRDCAVVLEDGTRYDIHPQAESEAFRERMEALPRGTTLHLLVNPDTGFAEEIRTDTEELLSFETSQGAGNRSNNTFMVLGILICVMGVFLLVYVLLKLRAESREALRKQHGGALRDAAPLDKGRMLLQTTHGNYTICYRRLKLVNELIVNGRVYDEYKAVIEFPHDLCAQVDGHIIHAGYNDDSYSYIKFDGRPLAKKQRMV